MKTIPEKRYLGRLCTRSHDWNGTGKSLRFKSGSHCCICKKLYATKYYKTEKCRLSLKRYYKTEQYKLNIKTYRQSEKYKLARNIYEQKDDGKYKAWHRKYNKTEKRKKYTKVYRIKNNTNKIYSQKYIKVLHDSYIKSLLVSRSTLKAKDISQELINFHRENLKIKRLIRKRG